MYQQFLENNIEKNTRAPSSIFPSASEGAFFCPGALYLEMIFKMDKFIFCFMAARGVFCRNGKVAVENRVIRRLQYQICGQWPVTFPAPNGRSMTSYHRWILALVLDKRC